MPKPRERNDEGEGDEERRPAATSSGGVEGGADKECGDDEGGDDKGANDEGANDERGDGAGGAVDH